MEQEQTQQQYPSNYSSYPQDNKADFLDKIRPEEIIEEIKQRLLGNRFDIQTGTWIRDLSIKEPLTETGASSITSLIFPASTRNVALSNLDEKIIWNRWMCIVKDACRLILDNWREYGIVSEAQIYFVLSIVKTNTLVALKQAENEGIRRMLNQTISENRTVSTYGEEKRGGLLGLFRR